MIRKARRRDEPQCAHIGAVPVEAVDCEVVAHLCPACGEQLPADWRISLTDLFFDPRLIHEVRR